MKPHLPLFRRGAKKNSDKGKGRFRADLKRAGLAIATIGVLSVLLSMHLLPSKVSLKLGQVSDRDIIAPRTARYTDTTDTERRRSLAAQSVGRVYDPVPNAADQSIGALKTVFHTVESFRSGERSVDRVREHLGSVLGARVSDRTFLLLLNTDAGTLREIEDSSLRLVSAAMGREIREDPSDMYAARKAVMGEATGLSSNRRIATAVGEIAADSIRPNRIYNEERTVALQQKAERSIQPTRQLIMRGDLVISKGEPVLQEHIEKFEALGLRNPTFDYRSVASLTLFVAIAVLLVLAYLQRYYRAIYDNTKILFLLSLIVIISTFALRIGGSMLGITFSPEQVGYLGVMWMVTAGMLVAVLVNPQVAVVIIALLSIVLSLMLNNELRFAAEALMTSLVGIYSVANIRDRSDLARAGVGLAATGVMLVWIIGGMNSDRLEEMLMGTFWAGLVVPIGATAIFLLGTVPLERLFGLTTHISLLELANTNKPLLRRLVMEAPGTYTHSMLVGYLAESAAEAIEADSLVARVASYYHDIGKIRRPHFFIENQHVENVHDRMNPTLSALVITSHIKDGIDIARQFKLPKIVSDMILQHHGTSLVQYFYSQISDEQEPCTALEHQFRYSGPKPQTKEAAIVMLADAVEAASRSLAKPTRPKIELLVNGVVAGKLRDGQLDESELTFREVSKITDSFVRSLTGTLHARIEYPDALGVETKRLTANGDSDTKLPKDAGESGENPDNGPTIAAS